MDLSALNTEFDAYTPLERLDHLFNTFDEDKILVTSSFGSTSIILLHLMSQVKPNHPIHFVDTSYLFDETHAFKNELIERFNLNVVDVKAPENRQRFTKENQSWRYNNDLCCFINKVEPVNELKKGKQVWISGLLAFQNANRSKVRVFEQKPDLIKFHPIIDMSAEEVKLYTSIYDLPIHPLVTRGYDSIGCTHCTKKGSGRTGRWFDSVKTECGLHV